jgi:hypothetical protein
MKDSLACPLSVIVRNGEQFSATIGISGLFRAAA